ISVTGAAFTGEVSSGNGASISQGGFEFYLSGSSTTLYFGLDASPGADRSVTLQGAYQLNQFNASGSSVSFANRSATGSVLITGDAEKGATLQASVAVTDADGVGAIAFQWRADGIAIPGATSDTFTLSRNHVGKLISVLASYTDGFGTQESLVSDPTAAVLDINHIPILNSGPSPQMPDVLEGATDPAGITISSLLVDGSVSDIDNDDQLGLEAIAIEGLNNSLGTWQYRLSGSSQWLTIHADLINSSTNPLALLLGSNDAIRLLPFGDLNGTLDNALKFRAWDMSSGTTGEYIETTPGLGAFSSASDTAAISVAPVNDAPDFSTTSGNGRLITPVGPSNDLAYGVSVQSDGDIIVVGQIEALFGRPAAFGVIRVNSDGHLDEIFDGDGKSILYPSNGRGGARNIGLTFDGKIILAGQGPGNENSNDRASSSVARLIPNGALDSAFGLSGWSSVSGSFDSDTADWVGLQPDGKVVLTGVGGYTAYAYERFLTRLLPDGSLDTTFGSNGFVRVGGGRNYSEYSSEYAGGAAIQADGKILVAGYGESRYGDADYRLVRLNKDGSRDTTFGLDGEAIFSVGSYTDLGTGRVIQTEDIGSGIAVQVDGKILLGGYSWSGSSYQFSIVRLNADGSLDSNFGGDGKTIISTGGSSNYFGHKVLLQSDGSILIVGSSTDDYTSYFVSLVRLKADGSLDPTFGNDGLVTISDASTYVRTSYGAALQPDGKILIAGHTYGQSGLDFSLIRLNPDGSLDTTFNGESVNTLGGSANYTENAAPVALDTSVSIVDVDLAALDGGIGNYAGASITLRRQGGAHSDDVFSARTNLVLDQSTSQATLSGVVIGGFTLSQGELCITFNGNATQARVDEALSSIGYANASDAPPSSVAIEWVFSDGNSGVQGAGGALTATGYTTVSIVGINDAPTGSVSITGLAEHDQTLTADTSAMADPDGLGVVSYQWSSNGLEIPGATASTFTLTSAEIGKTVTVRVSYTDQQGTAESLSSQPTATVIGGVNLTGTDLANTLVGSRFDDTLSGLAGNDTLTGLVGDDWLDGGAGVDSMRGGAGDDTYVVDIATDRAIELANEGRDTVRTALSAYTLGNELEELIYTGTQAFSAVGNTLANRITTGPGNDTLNGGLGSDTLEGGAGNDTYLLDSAGDVVIEHSAAGTDTVRTALSGLTLAAEVEHFVYVGTAAFAVTGNGLNNSIAGAAGADSLDGGAGNDTLVGGAGNDTYWVDAAGDVLTEAANGGFDTVRTTLATYTLAPEIDAAIFLGEASFVATGNLLSNVIVGGSGNDTLNGGLGNDTLDGGVGLDVLVGGGGNDTYRVDAAGDLITELAGGGVDTVVTVLAAYTLGVELESLTYNGTDSFVGVGNAFANTLTGGAGNDSLRGGLGNDSLDGLGGNDTLVGDAGNDTFVVDSAGDVVIELTNGGTDNVRTGLSSYTLPGEVESLAYIGVAAFTGTGNALANGLVGGPAADLLSGGAGNDSLNGAAGNDTMDGGLGNDTYTVDAIGDVLIEFAAGGLDTVRTTLVNYTLGAELENLAYAGTLAFTGVGNVAANMVTGAGNTDSLQGGGGNDTLNGGLANDTLIGDTGNDSLDGGAGADSMIGGEGNDTYVLDAVGDSIVELAAGGTDTVRTTLAAYTLAPEIEHLTYVGTVAFTGFGNVAANIITGAVGTDLLQGGDGNDTLVGAAGNDTLIGEAGHDSLDGGLGSDSMVGGDGDDVYLVDAATDAVIELTAGGVDTVRTTLLTYALSSELEHLSYIGSAAFSGTGNALANSLTGATGSDRLQAGAGNDTLLGAAGNDTLIGEAGDDWLDGAAGVDSMVGGDGDDTYLVDSVSDQVFELAVGGTDTVRTALAAYTLPGEVENLTATGTLALAGNGNTLANVITGSIAADVLSGLEGQDTLLGGAGNDTLRGGAGADRLTGDVGSDVFLYGVTTESPLGSGLQDLITDFVVGSDRISLSAIDANLLISGDQAFAWIGSGPITAAAQVNAVYDGTNQITIVSANVDGNLAPDVVIHLSGNLASSLSAASFLL
ncbi:MAG: hypothetical protein RLZ51_2079, partial [Pseudomonadota bacterium]